MPGKRANAAALSSTAAVSSAAHGTHHQPHHAEISASSTPTKHAALKPRDRSTSASATVKSLLGAYATATNVIAIKKHEDHDAGQELVEKRLFASRRSNKLDLSTSSSAGPSSSFPVTYQLFPRQVLLHEQMGHHLTELWLTNHSITALPPEIGAFASLRVLGLGGNALSSLPKELAQLASLEALYLERNRFKTMPSTVFPFQLRDVRLDCNLLAVFPVAVTKLRLLNRLGLSHNQIQHVPPEIRRLRNLVELDLDFNSIGPELPMEALQLLTKLERLGLEGNRLPSVALQWTMRMPALTYLRISGNRATVSRSKDGQEERDGGEHDNQVSHGVPVRHDGYFQSTRGYRVHGKFDDAASSGDGDELSSSGGKDAPQTLEGLVPCREQNLLNAEMYRAELANGIAPRRKH